MADMKTAGLLICVMMVLGIARSQDVKTTDAKAPVKTESEDAKLDRWHKMSESGDAGELKKLLDEVCADVMRREQAAAVAIKARDAEITELKKSLANGSAAYKQMVADYQKLAAVKGQPSAVPYNSESLSPAYRRTEKTRTEKALDDLETANSLRQVNDLLRNQAMEGMQYDLHKMEMQNRIKR